MNLIESLQAYTTSQKAVGTGFIITGLSLIAIALFVHFSLNNSSLQNGLKTGAIICGLFILIGGIGYRTFSEKTKIQQLEILNKDKDTFIEKESKRMTKVVKDYPVYQIAFGSFIILSLLMIWFIKNPFWHGIAFSIMILFTSVLIIEAFSHSSIKNYHSIITKK